MISNKVVFFLSQHQCFFSIECVTCQNPIKFGLPFAIWVGCCRSCLSKTVFVCVKQHFTLDSLPRIMNSTTLKDHFGRLCCFNKVISGTDVCLIVPLIKNLEHRCGIFKIALLQKTYVCSLDQRGIASTPWQIFQMQTKYKPCCLKQIPDMRALTVLKNTLAKYS